MLVGALDSIFDFRKLKKQGDGVPAVSAGEAAVAWEQAEREKAIQAITAAEETSAGEVPEEAAQATETKTGTAEPQKAKETAEGKEYLESVENHQDEA